jgi:hypothetical protein
LLESFGIRIAATSISPKVLILKIIPSMSFKANGCVERDIHFESETRKRSDSRGRKKG